MINFNEINKLYFVGIGGISMSGLAKLMLTQKKEVCGCDDNLTDITKNLTNLGIIVKKSYYKTGLKNCDLVVYTNAISLNNKNLIEAKKLNKPIIERAEFLGEITKLYKTNIAVSGTHGKTTTTSMIANIFEFKNPTIHVGGILDGSKSNIKIGNKQTFITEACEYNKSFLKLNPTYSIVLNIEKDHLDTYKNLKNLKQSFFQFIKQTSKKVIINYNILSTLPQNFDCSKLITFSINKQSTYVAKNLKSYNGAYSFDVYKKENFIGHINLNILGKHNVLNALAAISLCFEQNIPFEIIKDKLESFKSTKRRFEILYNKDFKVITDYAHHPTEIKASIKTALSISKNKLICIFEPHTYSRTISLFKEFLTCFKGAEKLILLPTYKAREKKILGGSAYDLYKVLKQKQAVVYAKNYDACIKLLKKEIEKNNVFLFLGAGTIDNLAREFASKLN